MQIYDDTQYLVKLKENGLWNRKMLTRAEYSLIKNKLKTITDMRLIEIIQK